MGQLHRGGPLAPGLRVVEVGVAEQVGHHTEIGAQQVRRGGTGPTDKRRPRLVEGLGGAVDGQHGVPTGPVCEHRRGVAGPDLLTVGGQVGRHAHPTIQQRRYRRRPPAQIAAGIPRRGDHPNHGAAGRAEQRRPGQARCGLAGLQLQEAALTPLERKRRRRPRWWHSILAEREPPGVAVVHRIASVQPHTRVIQGLGQAQQGQIRVRPQRGAVRGTRPSRYRRVDRPVAHRRVGHHPHLVSVTDDMRGGQHPARGDEKPRPTHGAVDPHNVTA